MKKNLVKVLTLALAAATVAGMSTMSVFAANTVAGTWTATSTDAAATVKTITVTNVTDKAAALTVTAYQVVGIDYSTGNYVVRDTAKANIANPETPTSTEITGIAKAIADDATTLTGITMTKSGNKYTADVEAGLYVVLATGADAVVYNPAVVAVNLDESKITNPRVVDMKSNFQFGPDAYLKSSESGFDKSIVDSSMTVNNSTTVNEEGDAVAFNAVVKFQIDEMTIPYYSDSYEEIKYEISDKLDPKSFKGVNNLKVVVGGNDVTGDTTAYTLTGAGKDATSFVVDFTTDFIRANAEKSVVVTYDSVFLETAGLNYAENKNTAKLRYSNSPDSVKNEKFKEIEDTTYHYTFGIDADVDAQAPKPGDDTETYELNKVTEQAGGENFVDGKSTSSKRTTGEAKDTKLSPNKLAGATFALYSDDSMSTPIKTYTSDENGHIQFKGLDTGIYYMKETKAPDTYTLNTNIYKIEIAATLNEEGIMTEYSITTTLSTDGGSSYGPCGSAVYHNTLAADAVAADGSVRNNITPTVTPVEIVDTKLAALPSTGGEGTIAITIGSALGMAGFLTLYIANKKKKKAE